MWDDQTRTPAHLSFVNRARDLSASGVATLPFLCVQAINGVRSSLVPYIRLSLTMRHDCRLILLQQFTEKPTRSKVWSKALQVRKSEKGEGW